MSIPNGSEDYPPTLRKTRFVCVSDTHGASTKDGAFKLPKGDVLIHAGDLTNQGGYTELKRTVEWIEAADFEVKIVVAGTFLSLYPSSVQRCGINFIPKPDLLLPTFYDDGY